MDGINLIFEENAIQKVVELAKERGTGARALRAILEEAMQDVMFRAPSMEDITECVIDEKVITTKIAPNLKRRLKRA